MASEWYYLQFGKMKIYFTILCSLLTQNVFPQLQPEVITSSEIAIIYRDSTQISAPIDTMFENEVFLISENNASNSDWIPVDVPQNKMSKSKSGIIDFYKKGYVKKEDVKLLDELPKMTENRVGITFQIIKAIAPKEIPEENLMYGLETSLEGSYQVDEMLIGWKGEIRLIDPLFYEDLYNVSPTVGELSSYNNKEFKIFQKGESFFIKHKCSDGAGSYEITWVIKDGNVQQRLIDTI